MDHQEELAAKSPGFRDTQREPSSWSTLLGVIALVSAIATGCASLQWTMVKPFRAPGESLETFPDLVWAEYDCDHQQRPFLVIEQNELMPTRIAAGRDFGHRMIYVMCPEQSTEVVAGELSTRIRFKGDPIVQQTDTRYEIKPGRWVVDAIVRLPANAEPGIYAYEIAFESDSLAFDKSLTFVVIEGSQAREGN